MNDQAQAVETEVEERPMLSVSSDPDSKEGLIPEKPEVDEVENEQVVQEEVEEEEAEIQYEVDEDGETVLDEDGNPVEAAPAVEFEKIQYEDKEYEVPKELKEAFLRQADYTKKTQSLAEERAALEIQTKVVEQAKQTTAEHQQHFASLVNIDKELKQYENVDWARLQADDPQAAQQHQFNMLQLQRDRDQTVGTLQQLDQKQLQMQQQLTARQVEEGKKVLAKEIEDWSPEVATQVKQAGVDIGFSAQFMDLLHNSKLPESPIIIKALHKAMKYDQMLANAQKKAKPAKVVVKPTKKVAGKTSIKPNIYSPKMTTEQRIKLRNKQEAAKR